MANRDNELSTSTYADDLIIRYSSQNYWFKLFDESIDLKTNKQKTMIISTIEIALLIIFFIDKKLIWWKRLFDQISFEMSFSLIIECDNMQIIKMIINSIDHYTTKLRHVDVHRHWLTQKIRIERINVKWISFAKMIADDFTKSLKSQKHREFVRLLDLENILI